MVSCFRLHRASMSSMVVLALFLLFSSYFWGLGAFSIILTPVALALSTFFTTTKQNSVVVEQVFSEEVLCSDEESSASTSGSILQRKGCQEQNLDHCLDYSTTSPDSLTESECLDPLSTTEDSEMEWPYREEMDQSQDGSISDEESLIEITLPTGNYIRQKAEEPQLQFLRKKPEFSPDSIFRQNHLMELLAEFNEMNEEENLIEIDISMGSIKYSRFEIEA